MPKIAYKRRRFSDQSLDTIARANVILVRAVRVIRQSTGAVAAAWSCSEEPMFQAA